MAIRPVFIPQSSGQYLISEVPVDFRWNPGMAPSQKKKNVVALHQAAKSRGLLNLLEISSKSEDEVGRRLSAFSLKIKFGDKPIFLECAYQGSKVFEFGGPYTDLYDAQPIEAKKDLRLRSSGRLIRFELLEKKYPLSPKNAFYDWLYIKALVLHRNWIRENLDYQGFTDIEFNPEKSINCQARAFAELVAMENKGQLDQAAQHFDYFAGLLPTV